MKKGVIMKFLFLLNFILLTSFTLPPAFAENPPVAYNRDISYKYSQDNIPSVCFFPVDESQWNGYKLAPGDWKKLTSYQKIQFVKEGIAELEGQKNTQIKEDADIMDIVLSLDNLTHVLFLTRKRIAVLDLLSDFLQKK